MFAIKWTMASTDGRSVTMYIGRRGERKSRLEKVEGWKTIKSAEKYLADKEMFRKSGNVVTIYEIIQF